MTLLQAKALNIMSQKTGKVIGFLYIYDGKH